MFHTVREEEITNKEQLTQEAKELLLTRKQLPVKFRTKLTELGYKFCSKCKEVKNLDQYRISATSNSGRRGHCFKCHPLKVVDSEISFEIDPSEFTLARSIAKLRRSAKKSGNPVELFGVAEVLEYFQLPRSSVPRVALIEPLDGFTLNNLKIDHTVLDQDNTNPQHKEK